MPTLITTSDGQDAAARLALARRTYRREHARPRWSIDVVCPSCGREAGAACRPKSGASGAPLSSRNCDQRRAAYLAEVDTWRAGLAAVRA